MMERTQNIASSLLENLEIERIQKINRKIASQTQRANPLTTQGLYFRHEIFNSLKAKLLPKDRFDYQSINLVIAKYFTYSQNPIYEKTSKLPKQFFVCGYCKEPFSNPSSYLKHCHFEQCPVNHDRSTFLFYFKNTFKLIKNSDLSSTLTENELSQLQLTSYGKQFLLFSDYDIIETVDHSRRSIIQCPTCKYKALGSMIPKFKNHCILKCFHHKLSQDKKILKVRYCDQNSIDFVNDISSLYLNLNILALFQDSYIRVQKNPNYINQSSQFSCSNCSSKFTSESSFLQHALFQCSYKYSPNSSHFIKRKLVPTSTINPNNRDQKLLYPQKKQDKIETTTAGKHSKKRQDPVQQKNKTRQSQNRVRQENLQRRVIQQNKRQVNKSWQQKLNNKYEHLKDLFEAVYFCGQCLNHFKTSEDYLTHCIAYPCRLNHERSSHFYFSKENKQPLQIQILKKEISSESIKKFRQNSGLEKIIKYELVNKKTNKFEYDHRGQFFCGKCSKEFTNRYFFINHLSKLCLSFNHENSSHQLIVPSIEINEKRFQDFMISLLYGIQIQRHFSQRKFQIIRNASFGDEFQFYCEKCDTVFENRYEYVYHSISVCNSLKNRNCSHYITSSVLKSIQHPLDVVEQKLLSGKIKKIQIDSFIEKKSEREKRTDHQEKNLDQMKEEVYMQKIQEEKQVQNAKNYESEIQEQIKEEIQQEKPNLAYLDQDIKLQPTNKYDEIKNSDQRRKFLRPNIDFIPQGSFSNFLLINLEFYCGKCKQDFKRKDLFIDHLEVCRQFQNKLSSHLYISNNRSKNIDSKTVIGINKVKTQFSEDYSGYKIFKDDTFICGCGFSGTVDNSKKHASAHNFEGFPGGSHAILRLMPFNGKKPSPIILSMSVKLTNPTHQFICPCKPWKKLSYESFTKHIMKRHNGKSPKFHMRLPQSQLNVAENGRQDEEVVQI